MRRLHIGLFFVTLTFFIGCKMEPNNHSAKEDQYTIYRDSSKIFLDSIDPKQKFFIEHNRKDSIHFYKYLKDKNLYPYNQIKVFHDEILIKNRYELIEFVEPILFRIYGKKNIISERPYSAYLIGDYWFLNGSLPPNTQGGVFEITVNRKTCEIIYLIHGK